MQNRLDYKKFHEMAEDYLREFTPSTSAGVMHTATAIVTPGQGAIANDLQDITQSTTAEQVLNFGLLLYVFNLRLLCVPRAFTLFTADFSGFGDIRCSKPCFPKNCRSNKTCAFAKWAEWKVSCELFQNQFFASVNESYQ